MAGYSKKTLAEKLGMKPGMRALILEAPKIEGLVFPEGFNLVNTIAKQLDYVHFFTKDKKGLAKMFPILRKNIKDNGVIWISWPKKSSGVETDLDENIVREIGLKNGMVDVKVIAVDEVWSGLKFVFRLVDRAKK